MTERETILVVDDDQTITEALGMTLEQPGRRVIVCSDIESAEVCLRAFDVNCLVSDIQFSGAFGFEGLHFLARVKSLAPGIRIVLMTGNASGALRESALASGASAVMAKPFTTSELERAIGSVARRSDEPYDLVPFPSLEEIRRDKMLEPAFQPIVDVLNAQGEPFAFEALIRASGRWFTCGPVGLLDYAEKKSRLAELNLIALDRSIETARALPGSPLIFINVDPPAFEGEDLSTMLKDAAGRASVPFSRIVLEITERSAFSESVAAGRTFDELREAGVRFALDDHGSAYSHLSVINRIRPSFIKISAAFGMAFEQDTAKQRVVRHVVNLARDFDCQTVLEGIETEATASAALATGVSFAQGYYFGRPQTPARWSKTGTGDRAAFRSSSARTASKG